MDETEKFLRESFDANFERLREESGRAISPDARASALEQVLLYWRKLMALAEQVTETEIHLVLPEQVSPAGHRYTLEGVVDVLRQGDTCTMYDVKTYLDADAARDHIAPHYRQLNVYAHIWQTLREHALDKLAIIATRPTRSLKHAIGTGDSRRIETALNAWNPVLEIDLQQGVVEEVIQDFGRVVDEIEGRHFKPPSVEVLRAPSRPGGRVLFGTDVCSNCDARFSCTSYRHYVLRAQPSQRPEVVLNYYVADFGSDAQRDEWLDANLETLNRSYEPGEAE